MKKGPTGKAYRDVLRTVGSVGWKEPQTFDVLEFAHYRGSKEGRFIVWRETSGKRMRAKLLRIKQSIQRLMHEPIAEGGKTSRKQRRYGSVREAISVGRPYRDNDYYYGRSKHDA